MTYVSEIYRMEPTTKKWKEEVQQQQQQQQYPFNGPLSGTTRVSRYQKGKPILILLKQETEELKHKNGYAQKYR